MLGRMSVRLQKPWWAPFEGLVLALVLCVHCLVAAQPETPHVRNIVLVHGAWADGSGWKGIYDILTKRRYHVTIVQEPETSFKDDVEATRRAIALEDGPCILVGHSYGGAVITEAGNDPSVLGLVYVAAHMPDAGESEAETGKRFPSDLSKSTAIKKTPDGFTYLDPELFQQYFAADLPSNQAALMARSQVLNFADNFKAIITTAAWRTRPSWMLVAGADRTINPDLERWYAKRANSRTIEVPGASHAIYVSHPKDVAAAIEDAAAHSKDVTRASAETRKAALNTGRTMGRSNSGENEMTNLNFDKDDTALLVIDPYNDFISEGGKVWNRIKGVAEANQCVPHMQQVLQAARKNGIRVFYAMHRRYRPGDYETWKYIAPIQKRALSSKVFEYGTWGGEFRQEFEPRPGDIVAAEHWGSSGFANTDLDMQLKKHAIHKLIVMGMIAHTCVEATIRYAAEIGYDVTMVKDATADYSEKEMRAALEVNIPNYAGAMVSTDEIVAALSGQTVSINR